MTTNELQMRLKERICIAKKYGVGLHQADDYARREANQKAKRKLCKRCNGTGNQLFSMYQKCELCGGTGVYRRTRDHE